MRLLLDECVPKKLKHELSEHEVFTVPEMGWVGVKNGALLRLASKQFDILLTTDQSIEHQQNLADVELAILVLVAVRNDIDLLKPLMPRVREVLPELQAGTVTSVEV